MKQQQLIVPPRVQKYIEKVKNLFQPECTILSQCTFAADDGVLKDVVVSTHIMNENYTSNHHIDLDVESGLTEFSMQPLSNDLQIKLTNLGKEVKE